MNLAFENNDISPTPSLNEISAPLAINGRVCVNALAILSMSLSIRFAFRANRREVPTINNRMTNGIIPDLVVIIITFSCMWPNKPLK